IPHHLIDVLEPRDVCSAGEYARWGRAVIGEISTRARLPIVTGGTGFYLRALLEGVPPLPTRDESLRTKLLEGEKRRAGSLHKLLSRLDPAAAARIHANDIQKTIRALEVRLLTNTMAPPPEVAEPLRGYQTLKIGLSPPRENLYKALDVRAEEM